MDVTWLGHGCFRLRGRGATVITDPYPPAAGPRLRGLDADVVTVSHGHDNHSFTEVVGSDPFLVEGPGEYEASGVTVLGLSTFHDRDQGASHGRNTIYVIDLDDVRVCHLGDLGHALDDETLDRLGNIDVLLVPVGGGHALDAVHAAEVVRQVEPRVVVPMHFAHPAVKVELGSLDRFLKEMGVAEAEAQPKLAIQASAGDSETRLVVLEARI
ncbi:MAG: MBL fold metallo-hydrolase [Candidatus Dormibacteraeota bacterium]|nr:MBL fold metallo-hydrolase [Candidatus Dormibacteraeota bacterium]